MQGFKVFNRLILYLFAANVAGINNWLHNAIVRRAKGARIKRSRSFVKKVLILYQKELDLFKKDQVLLKFG